MKKQQKGSEADINAEESGLIDFQRALISAIRELGISKGQLAEAMGISPSRVSQLFSPDANPTLKLVARAMAAVDWEVGYSSRKNLSTAAIDGSSAGAWNQRGVDLAPGELAWYAGHVPENGKGLNLNESNLEDRVAV